MFKIFSQTILYIGFISVIALSATTSPPAMNDPYTGLYYVHGSKIVTYYNCPFIGLCGPDDGPFMDTTNIASVVAVKWTEDKTDKVHFYGLPGADEGETKLYHGRRLIMDHADAVYSDDVFKRLYGSLSGNSFEIQFNNAGFFYEATGNITQGIFDLQGKFTTRTTTVEYELEGEKIDF